MIKKRIVLIDTISLLQASTGIKSYILELTKIRDENMEFISYPRVEKISGIKFFQHGIWWRNLIFHGLYFLWKSVWLPLVLVRFKVDSVICPDFIAPMWKLNISKIIVIHDASLWKFPKEYGQIWRRYFIKMIKLGLRGNSQIVATSRYTKQSLENIFLKKSPIHVVYQSNNFFFQKNTNATIKFLSSINVEPGKYILHVGFFGKRKNHKTLVKAFHLFRQNTQIACKLVLVGGRSIDRHMDSFQETINLIASFELQNEVIMPGYVSRDELAELYLNALMLIFPSYEEGFGIPVVEAMQQNLPVIVSDSGSLPEIGGDAVLVFNTFDEKNLAEKMTELAANKKLREQLVEKGKKRLKVFSRKHFYEQFNDIIESSI